MSEANPYQSFLGDREPISVLIATPTRIRELTRDLTSEQIGARASAGKWSIHEIVAHLADTELVFAARCRCILFEDDPALVAYDQDAWVEGWRREREAFGDTLERFLVLRESQLRLFRNLSPADAGRAGRHPEYGRQTIGSYPPVLAGHDLNHLLQVEAARGKLVA